MIALVLTLNDAASAAVIWVAIFGFTFLTIVTCSWIAHIHYRGVDRRHHELVMAMHELEVATEQRRILEGPSMNALAERAKAENKLAIALERRVEAEQQLLP